ncbi:MAG: FkbM family methyltransferase [Cyanobacteria bacterium P01_A01_bin.37]
MKLYLLNYADDRFGHKGGKFLRNQAKLNESARQQGIDDIVSWTWPKLAATSFYAENQEYLDKNRFENGAVWKPFIVQNLLREIEHGDIIFYYDCGSYEINRPVKILIDLCLRNKGTLFHEWGEKNSKFTKRDAFVYMGCDEPQYHNAVALQNTWFLLQKSALSEKFIDEWLQYNLDERIASYIKPNTCGLPNLMGFVENRGDQSIFSNLAVKYKIKTFRGASGIENRHVNNFIDALSLESRTQKFLQTIKLQTKLYLKNSAYRVRMTGPPLRFQTKHDSYHLHPYGESARSWWSDNSSKYKILEAILSLIDKNSVVVEVGSNVGVTTVPLARQLHTGKLLAIEADSELCQLLKKNLGLNDCLKHVDIVPAAVADKDGVAELQVNRHWRDTHNTIGKPIDENCQIVATKEVPKLSLPTVLDKHGFLNPDLLIIDASGAELPILQGAITALSKHSPPIIVYNCQHRACLGFGYQPYKTQELLREYGYRLFKLGYEQELVEMPEGFNHQGFIFCFTEANQSIGVA